MRTLTHRTTAAPALAALAALLVLAAPAAARPVPAGKPPAAIVAQIPGLPFAEGKQAPGTHVATVGDDGAVYAALIVQRGRLAVYLCDGKRVSEWFGGRVAGGRFDLRTKKRTRITGRLSGRTITGSVTLRGKGKLRYVARPAEGKEGLFLGKDTRFRGKYKYRWIRIENSLRGASTEDAGGIKGGVSTTQPVAPPTTGPTGPGSGTGGGGGTETQPTPVTCEELFAEMSRLNRAISDIKKKGKPTGWDAARIALLTEQLQATGSEYFKMNC